MTRTQKKAHDEPYYDLFNDWSLIVSSFQTQYGIRLSTELPTMGWSEFSYLLVGLSGDTPLGRIVAIRAENDPEAVRNMTASQKQIRNEWRRKMAMQKPKEEVEKAYEGFKNAFVQLAK